MLELWLKGEEVFAPSAGPIPSPCLLTEGGRYIKGNAGGLVWWGSSQWAARGSDEQEPDHTARYD